jgi:UDP-glucose 4-epimerase
MGLFKTQKALGLRMTIVGDGEQRRDFTHISDVVNANLLAAKYVTVTGPVNIGTGRNYSINELAQMIGGETINLPHRIGETQVTLADITRAKNELLWEAKVKLEDVINS